VQLNKDGTRHERPGEEHKTRLRWAIDDGKYPPHIPPQPREEDKVIIRRRVSFQERTDQTPEKNNLAPTQNYGRPGAVRALSMGEVCHPL